MRGPRDAGRPMIEPGLVFVTLLPPAVFGPRRLARLGRLLENDTGIIDTCSEKWYKKYLYLARGERTPLRLTQFSNFAIRLLMYAALKGNAPSAVPEIAKAYGISYDHLKKAAAELCRRGYLETVRGRNGGVRLAKDPRRDPDRRSHPADGRETSVLVECFDPATNTCPLLASMPAARRFTGSSRGLFTTCSIGTPSPTWSALLSN